MDAAFGEGLNLALGAIGAVVLLGAFIARFTKTPKDDEFFARLKSVLKLK